MYQALYRKWRPKTFADVVGQEHITETLQHQVAEGRLSHAYLFTGTRGTGKTTCAKILARAVNCEHPENGNPCNRCPSCLGIESGRLLDVVELDAASNNGVDSVRALRDEAIYSPAQVKKRVYIVDEVHMLSTPAFNALLKILEEPPRYTAFVLTADNSNAVIGTVLSRVVRLRMGESVAAEYSEKASDIVKKLADAVLSPYEYDRIEATAQMDGNKVLTAEVLDLFVAVLRDAMVCKSGGKPLLDGFSAQSKRLSDSLSPGKIIEIYETVDGLLKSLENNPNYTLLSAVLCAKI